MATIERFWDFSIRTYRREGVSAACLRLQDGYGLDINLLFFCCWVGKYHGVLAEPLFRRALDYSRAWARHVVAPLRNSRRWMKNGGCAAESMDEEECMRLREQIKQAEFAGERIQETTLEAMLHRFGDGGTRPGAGPAAATDNTRRYLAALGVRPEAAGSDDLGLVLAAAFGDGGTEAFSKRLREAL